ncbi:MAG: hypothetical protein IPN67_22315 [Bacteroidales bacterium]|nr:hypothetical protein [Bacteroidales bacterium]
MKPGHTIILFFLVLLFESGCKSVSSDYPILILGTNSNFGTYTGEILKAEGFNEFQIDSLTDRKINLTYLKRFDIVILNETVVNQTQKDMFSDYLKAGGNLIAFSPDILISELFGIIHTNSSIKEGYIKIDTINTIGKGLVYETIQFHGYSNIYKLNGGEEIASLFLNSGYYSGFPSVVLNDYGAGHAAAFTYNLPKSIVLTRQGNPDWAGEERDKVDGPTATDLFYPHKGEAQWNDPEKIAVPQADEQMRLLSHIIESFNTKTKPLPRFWYFPDMYKCIFIFTIDGEDTPESDIDKEFADVLNKGGNATLYEIGTYINPSVVTRWRSEGHEVAIHYNDVPDFADPDYTGMNAVFDTMTANFRNAYGLSPKTVRNHWVVWCSRDSYERKQFAEQAVIEEKYGIGLDCNYYQFGGNKVYPNWIGDVGHFTGSGIPMKFADVAGRVLNIYQSNTQLPDETWLKENIEKKSRTLIDRSLDEENYTYINANFHTWYWPECRQPGMRVLDYCNSRGVPIWPAERVYEFLKMKDEASFTDIKWSVGQLTFTIKSALENREGLTFLLPAKYGNSKIESISDNRQPLNFQNRKIKGCEYAMTTITPGKTHEISAIYR